jgi:hypothetical protein
MKIALRLVGLLLLALLGLQLYFAGRIVLMRWVDPQSTSFQRAEAHRLVRSTGHGPAATAAAPAQDRRRLDHHPAVGQESVSVGRTHLAAQGAGAGPDADA